MTAVAEISTLDFRTVPVYQRAAQDWYVEPAWCVEALIDAEGFTGSVWDPAAGGGNIARVFRDRGHVAIGTDIVKRDHEIIGHFDFTDPDWLPDGTLRDNIVSNPPFNLAEEFVRRALQLARLKVAMLLPLTFLESTGRLALWAKTPLARVLVSAPRISMPPGGMAVKAEGGKKAFAWFVWRHGYRGPPQLGWINKP